MTVTLAAIVRGDESTSGMLREGIRPDDGTSWKWDESARAQMRGSNLTAIGFEGRGVAMPRVSEGDYGDMLYLTGDSYTAIMEDLLRRFCKRDGDVWKDYFSVRTSKRTPHGEKGLYTVVKSVEPRYVPPHERRTMEKKSNAKVKHYTLCQLLIDSYLQTKYGFHAKFRRDVQLLATTRPADAAATLRDAIQAVSPGIRIEVSTASYSTSKQQAAAAIRNLAAECNKAGTVRAQVIGELIFLYSEDDKWMVRGPLSNSHAVTDVYHLAKKGGTHEVIFLLASETQTLGIDIFIGSVCVSPSIIGHVRDGQDLPAESDADTVARMSSVVVEHLKDVAVNIRPVMSEDGLLASAVQIDPRMLLVHNHVIRSSATARVGDAQLFGSVNVSSDLWMQKVDGQYHSWNFREALPGEDVAIYFHNGVKPVLSPTFSVNTVDGLHITSVYSSGVVPGMSGGALIALRDGAFLGMHSGAMARCLLAVSVNHATRLDLVEMADEYDNGAARTAGSADAVVAQLKQRGRHKQFLTSMFRLVALYKGNAHVGSAAMVSGALVTTCPVGKYSTEDGQELTFTPGSGFFSECKHSMAKAVEGFSAMRAPQLHEKVVIAGIGPSGHYVSAETTVRQVSPGGRAFLLAATTGNVYPLASGLIMSIRDGAVLGFYVSDSMNPSLGKLSLCSTMPVVPVEEQDPVAVLQVALPMLHVANWDGKLLQEALRHCSLCNASGVVSNMGLAKLGDAYAKLKLYERLRAAGVAESEWTDYFKNLQNNVRLADLAWELGIARLLKRQTGLSFEKQSKVYADMMEAVLYVVALEESAEVVDECFAVLGVVPAASSLNGSGLEYSRMMRRPSEIGLSTDLDLLGERVLTPVD